MGLDERGAIVSRLSGEISRILVKEATSLEVLMGVLADCAAIFSSQFVNGDEIIEKFCEHCRNMDAIYRKKRREE